MKFITFVTTAALIFNAIAAPSPNPEAAPALAELVEKDTLVARATCNNAYSGNTPSRRGPGVIEPNLTVFDLNRPFSLSFAMSDLAPLIVVLEYLRELRRELWLVAASDEAPDVHTSAKRIRSTCQYATPRCGATYTFVFTSSALMKPGNNIYQ
ncbi:hypothetical protein AAF712_009568 [Marasmius tenuissimus]|uniref:Uncharacterized protein n=1 Tax=Marasmius tenuissimus TaxID=585030 RepID=A0ABR2ZQW4_9AGAR